MIGQVALPALPDGQTVAMAVLFFLAGMSVPTAYGIERLQGFGRALASKLPYRSPPGMEPDQALRQAVERGESEAAQDGDDGSQ